MALIPFLTKDKLKTFNSISLIIFTSFSLWLWSAILGAFYSTIFNSKDLLESDRTYNSKVYFWGNDFRNSFGQWYGITLFIHVITALLMTLLITISALNMFFPSYFGGIGTQFHRILGLLYIIGWMIHMIDGMIPAFALTVNRGLSPCQYLNDDQISQHNPHSFSVLFFVHVLYWIFRINENISYGLASFVLTDKIGDISWIKYSLLFLSGSSIALVAARLVILAGYFVYFQEFPLPCVDKLPLIFWIFVYFLEVPTVLASIQNVKYLLYPEMELFESWKHHHRYNMKLSVFITFRTFIASIVYKINPITTSIWYLATSILYIAKIIIDTNKGKRTINNPITRQNTLKAEIKYVEPNTDTDQDKQEIQNQEMEIATHKET